MTVKVNQGMKYLNMGCVAHVETANDAFEYWYNELCDQYYGNLLTNPSRDGSVAAEFINAITIIDDPTRNIITSELRKLPMRYAVGELLWYLSGNNKLEAIQPFTKAWDRMSDDGETVNSNYGHKIHEFYGFDQWEHVKNLLRKDPLSRQAVIHIKNATDKPTNDLPCTVAIQYFIRDGKLHSTVFMRSNDVWMGFPYDVFAFTCLQVKLAMELEVEIGSYTHIAGSLHLYTRYLPDTKKPVEDDDDWHGKNPAVRPMGGNVTNNVFIGDLSKAKVHSSDCATNNEPAYPNEACDCEATGFPTNDVVTR